MRSKRRVAVAVLAVALVVLGAWTVASRSVVVATWADVPIGSVFEIEESHGTTYGWAGGSVAKADEVVRMRTVYTLLAKDSKTVSVQIVGTILEHRVNPKANIPPLRSNASSDDVGRVTTMTDTLPLETRVTPGEKGQRDQSWSATTIEYDEVVVPAGKFSCRRVRSSACGFEHNSGGTAWYADGIPVPVRREWSQSLASVHEGSMSEAVLIRAERR